MNFTRRNFLKGTAAVSTFAIAGPFSSLAQTAKPVGNAPRQNICAFEKPLQFLSYDELSDLMAELGFNGVEATVRPGGHVLPEKVEEDLPRFVGALKKRGLEMTVLTSGISGTDSPHAEKVLRTAAKLGVKHYRMNWFRYNLSKPLLPQLDEIRPKLKDLVALNRELGLTALYQNHAGSAFIGAPLWDIFSVIKDFDPKHLALAYDIRHATVEGGLSWPIQFNLVKAHIGAVFVKDCLWENGKLKNVPLGEGMVDKKFFAMLKETKFTGPISLHVEYLDRSNDKNVLADAFRKDLAALKALL